MSRIKKLYPGGKNKAVTLSYDDGVEQDRRLVAIFNKYGLKGTFNLNSGIQDEKNYWNNNGHIIKRINLRNTLELYKGHEVAVHSLTHPNLVELDRDQIIKEISEDKKNLELWFGYPIRGMAYPYGAYNEKLVEIIKSLGIEYARTVQQHENFNIPEKFFEWSTTCHHNNPKLMNRAKDFKESNLDELAVFYVWGHSYEFDVDSNWEIINAFSEYISNDENIWYATNIEIIDYLKAIKMIKISDDNSKVINLSSISVWVENDGEIYEIKPNEQGVSVVALE